MSQRQNRLPSRWSGSGPILAELRGIPLEEDPDFLKVKVYSLGLSEKGYVVFLQPEGQSDKVVPVFIGTAEAHSIVSAVNKQPHPRPMTHDLMKNVMDLTGVVVDKVAVTEIRDDTFYGRMYLRRRRPSTNGKAKDADETDSETKNGAEEWEEDFLDVDSRPSDAIGLALRYQAPIFIHRKVYEMTNVFLKARGNTEGAEPKGSLEPEDPRVLELKAEINRAEQEERYTDAFKLREQLRELTPEVRLLELKRELDLAVSDERYDDCIKIQAEIKDLELKQRLNRAKAVQQPPEDSPGSGPSREHP